MDSAEIIREDIELCEEGLITSVYNKEERSLLVLFILRGTDENNNPAHNKLRCIAKFSFPNIT